jgi:hypothetical protein
MTSRKISNKAMTNFIAIPRSVAVKQQTRLESMRLAAARQRYTYPSRSHHADYERENLARNAKREKNRTGERLEQLFIMWDGESPQDSGYSFFANSAGYEILHPYLSTLECFEMIIDTAMEYPKAIHISFGFNLDVSYICKDLPRRQLSALHHFNKTIWRDWEIEHIPHKWFMLKHGNIRIKIYDLHTYFAGGYVSALIQFNVGTEEERKQLAQEKARRSEFLWADIKPIAEYCRLELKLGPELGEALREALYLGANYVPKSWHGPGAIARMALKRHKVYDAMAESPPEVALAARYAFAGGRFEQFLAGHAQTAVYEYDINSAYPYYATMLPNLAKGKWRKGKRYESGKFAVYHIQYEAESDIERMYPLFRRMEDYSVCWPHYVDGWYWGPEAELVANDPDAKFVESWVFDEDDEKDRPFTFLGDYYLKRKAAERAGSMAAYAFKTIINAVFGQLAQRTGWDRKHNKAPHSHQLEWAGYITSACRAAVYKAALQAGDKLISINTDSVQSLCPLNLDTGNMLGQWKESEYEDGIFWQSGIYFLREPLGYPDELGYGWDKAKARGIPRGTYTAEDLLRAMASGDILSISKSVFVTYGLADNGRWSELNTWTKEPHEFRMGGSGKRQHHTYLKGQYCIDKCSNLHRLTQWNPSVIFQSPVSVPHYLPWLQAPDTMKSMFDDLMFYDADGLDPEEEWVRDYAAA